MKKEGKYTLSLVIVSILLISLSLNFISAKQPQIQLAEGIDIQFPQFDFHAIGENINLSFHLFNGSNGVPLNNGGISCEFELYNHHGKHIYENDPVESGGERTIIISGGNFSIPGFYAYVMQCNSSSLGGFVSADFIINRKGNKIEIAEAVIYLILAFGVLLLFLISFYFMIITPYSNKMDDRGAVIQLTKLKYVKLGLILLTWVLFTWFLNILIGLSDNFVSLIMYYGFFGFMFTTMNLLALPIGIIIIVISLFEIIRDSNIQGNIAKFGKG